MSLSWKVSCVALGSALAMSAVSAVAAPSTHSSLTQNGFKANSPIIVTPAPVYKSSPIIVTPRPVYKMASSPIIVTPAPVYKASPIIVTPRPVYKATTNV